MGSLWGLVLPLFFCCWGAGSPSSSAGPGTLRPDSLVTMNHTEVTAVTLGVKIGSEGNSQIPELTETAVPSYIPLETQTLGTQTSDETLNPVGTISEAEMGETKTTFPATEARAITKITPHEFMAVITTPMATSATEGSPSGTGITTVGTVRSSDLSEAVFGTLCTDDSSEEAKRIAVETLMLAHTSREARSPALERDSGSAIATSQALAPDITTLPKALVAYTIADIEVMNCSVIEIETTAIIPVTSDRDQSPTGGKTLFTPETSALPGFTEAKSHVTRTPTSSETASTASATASATPDTTVETPLTASSTGGETTATKATSPHGTLVTISMNPLEKTSALSVEMTNPSEDSEAVTISAAGSSAVVSSLSEVATLQSPTPSDTATPESTTSGPVPISRSPPPSVHLTMVNSSQEADISSAKSTASAKTLKTASGAGREPPAATPTTAGTTEVPAGGDRGFLLLRLSVASPEDLTDPKVAERLMHQLRHELHAHIPPTQVHLLRVRSD